MNLTLPGFGTLMGGRASGYPQVALQGIAFLITMAFGGKFLLWTVKNWSQITNPDSDPFTRLNELWLASRWVLLGIAVFAVAWVWSLASSLAIFRAATKDTPTLPPRWK
jgi:uncharacterized protein involved in response to NO